MWQKDRSADAAGRLENLKELIRSMEEFENLQGFLEHVSLVMDVDRGEDAEAVSIMTLHAAKGLEFDCVFLPGWEEGLLPHQRSLDENGRAGLEEERRLAHVGLTRARKRARISFVANRRIHGSWSSSLPSRFIDELPEAHVEVAEAKGFGGFGGYGNYGSRFDTAQTFGSNYGTPGWRRAQKEGGGFGEARQRGYGGGSGGERGRSGFGEQQQRKFGTGAASPFRRGDRVFHQKFGNGEVKAVDGNKLTIQFDRAGEKRVVDSFVQKV